MRFLPERSRAAAAEEWLALHDIYNLRGLLKLTAADSVYKLRQLEFSPLPPGISLNQT